MNTERFASGAGDRLHLLLPIDEHMTEGVLDECRCGLDGKVHLDIINLNRESIAAEVDTINHRGLELAWSGTLPLDVAVDENRILPDS
jgi:hypothetical protein